MGHRAGFSGREVPVTNTSGQQGQRSKMPSNGGGRVPDIPLFWKSRETAMKRLILAAAVLTSALRPLRRNPRSCVSGRG
jgi:hypothetical protein